MRLLPTPLQRRAAAVALLLLAVALLIGLFAVPTLLLNSRYDRYIEDYTDRLQRYRRISAQRPAIEEATTVVLRQDGRKYYLRGATPTLAVAELQTLVTRIIESHKGRILTSQPLPDKDEPGTPGALKVTIQVQLAASIIPLQLILHAIETQVPYLFIEKAIVSSSTGRAYKPEPGIQPEFSVNLTISGYAIREEAKP